MCWSLFSSSKESICPIPSLLALTPFHLKWFEKCTPFIYAASRTILRASAFSPDYPGMSFRTPFLVPSNPGRFCSPWGWTSSTSSSGSSIASSRWMVNSARNTTAGICLLSGSSHRVFHSKQFWSALIEKNQRWIWSGMASCFDIMNVAKQY